MAALLRNVRIRAEIGCEEGLPLEPAAEWEKVGRSRRDGLRRVRGRGYQKGLALRMASSAWGWANGRSR